MTTNKITTNKVNTNKITKNNIQNLHITAQTKFLGDAYAGGFSCGLSMLDSATMQKFKIITENKDVFEAQTESGINIKTKKTFSSKAEDIIIINTSITNNSKENITLEMLTSFCITDIPFTKIHRMQSFWSAEGKLRTDSIYDLNLEKSWNGCAYRIEKFGNVGSMPVRKYFPLVILENESTGIFTGVQLYIASSWQIELNIKEKETYSVAGGIADRDFGQWTKELKSGESFIAPKVVIAQGKSILDVCDKLVKTQNPDISPVDNSMDIMFNEYCTTWGNPTFENVKKICDKICDKGIKYLVIDSGWYGDEENWWDKIGDWTVNKKRFPDGIKSIADYIKSKGMIGGLWFEMESVAHQSAYYENAEHLVKKDGFPLTVGSRRFFDMEDPWVKNYLKTSVIDLLKDSGFGYVKIDYNESMGMGCDGINVNKDSLGENLRKKVEASKDFFREIKKCIPNIVIENCSSGGHRNEPSMLELVSQASFSDAHETVSIPLIAANLQRVIKPEQSQIWVVLRKADSDSRIFYSMISSFLGRMCLSGDIYDLSEHQWTIVEEGIKFYKQISHIIKNGKTIAIETSVESYNKPVGSQLVVRHLVDDDKQVHTDEGIAIFHRFENSSPINIEEKLQKLISNELNEEESIENQPKNPKFQIISEYGNATSDLSAKAWYYKIV